MLQQNLDVELIAKLTDLDEAKVKEIQAQWENEQEGGLWEWVYRAWR